MLNILPCKPTDSAQNGGFSYLSVGAFLPSNSWLSLLEYIKVFDDIGWFTFFFLTYRRIRILPLTFGTCFGCRGRKGHQNG